MKRDSGKGGLLSILRDLIVRKAEFADADEIASVNILCWRDTYRGIVPDSYLDAMSHEKGTENASAQLRSLHPAFVAVENGRIVGFATGGPDRSADGVYDGELYTLYILREAQRLGIGARLVRVVAQALLAEGHNSMKLWVLRDNKARSFYERLGAQFLHDGSFIVDGVEIPEMAYGWPDITTLLTGPE